jgi:hypothetical protein
MLMVTHADCAVRAFNYNIPGSKDVAAVRAAIADIMVPEFTPQKGVKIQVNTQPCVFFSQKSRML